MLVESHVCVTTYTFKKAKANWFVMADFPAYKP